MVGLSWTNGMAKVSCGPYYTETHNAPVRPQTKLSAVQKKTCTPVSSVMTFVNKLILSPCNSVNLMFVVVNTHEREWKDMSSYSAVSTVSWEIEIGPKSLTVVDEWLCVWKPGVLSRKINGLWGSDDDNATGACVDGSHELIHGTYASMWWSVYRKWQVQSSSAQKDKVANSWIFLTHMYNVRAQLRPESIARI